MLFGGVVDEAADNLIRGERLDLRQRLHGQLLEDASQLIGRPLSAGRPRALV